MSTALFIDTKNRFLPVYTVDVTTVPGRGLVLRFGAEVGPLKAITARRGQGFVTDLEFPVIIPTAGYSAQSSAGHVKVFFPWDKRQKIVGVCGMPWMDKKSLRRLTKPMDVIVVPAGATIKKIVSHTNSNPATADAAASAMRMIADLYPQSVHIQEGQSDVVQGWSVYHPGTDVPDPVWVIEHRGDKPGDMFRQPRITLRLAPSGFDKAAITLEKGMKRCLYSDWERQVFDQVEELVSALRQIIGIWREWTTPPEVEIHPLDMGDNDALDIRWGIR